MAGDYSAQIGMAMTIVINLSLQVEDLGMFPITRENPLRELRSRRFSSSVSTSP